MIQRESGEQVEDVLDMNAQVKVDGFAANFEREVSSLRPPTSPLCIYSKPINRLDPARLDTRLRQVYVHAIGFISDELAYLRDDVSRMP